MKINDFRDKFVMEIIILVSLALLAIFIPFINIEYMLSFTMFFCLSIILIIFLFRKSKYENEQNTLLKLCLFAFLIRFLMVLVTNLFPSLQISSDDGTYISRGLKIVEEWNSGKVIPNFQVSSGHFFYGLYNAIFFYLFGYYPILIKIANSFLGILAGINIYFATKRLYGPVAAKTSTFLVLFFPSIIFWQTQNLKEALVVFLITGITNNMTKMKEKNIFKTFYVSLIYAFLLFITRDYAGVFLGLIVCVHFLYISKIAMIKKTIVSFTILALIGVVSYKTQYGFFGINIFQTYSLSFINYIRTSAYEGGSHVLQNISTDTLPKLIRFLPIGFVYFMFSPFINQISGSIIMFFSAIENILWYLLFLMFTIGIYKTYKMQKTIITFILIILSGFVIFYSASMGNMGLAYRFRDMLLPVFFIFSSVGITEINKKWVTRIK